DNDDGDIGIVTNVGGARRIEVPRDAALHNAVWGAGDNRRSGVDDRHGLTADRTVGATVSGPPGACGSKRVSAKSNGDSADNDDGDIGIVTNVGGARRIEVPRDAAFHNA